MRVGLGLGRRNLVERGGKKSMYSGGDDSCPWFSEIDNVGLASPASISWAQLAQIYCLALY